MSEKAKIYNFPSEELRQIVLETTLNRGQKNTLAAIAVQADWNSPIYSSVDRKVSQIAKKADVSDGHVRRTTRELVALGYIRVQVKNKYSEKMRRWSNAENTYTLTPLMFLESKKFRLEKEMRSGRVSFERREEVGSKIAAITKYIASIKADAQNPAKRPEAMASGAQSSEP